MMTLQMFKCFLYAILLSDFALMGYSQDPSGFISIDCGSLSTNSSYNDTSTGINYVSDQAFIDTGESKSISEVYRKDHQEQLWSLRSFPEGNRNCYKIDVIKGHKYLIRAWFLYGNYDENQMVPEFDLYLATDLWSSVELPNNFSSSYQLEIIHFPHRNRINVCLVKTGNGIPFISSLELRPLGSASYQTQKGSLSLYERYDAAGSSTYRRYPDDVYDRIWNFPPCWKAVRPQPNFVYEGLNDSYHIPSEVMRTASTPKKERDSFVYKWTSSLDKDSDYYVYMHFAEIQQLQVNQSREFNIFTDGIHRRGPYTPTPLQTKTIEIKFSSMGDRSHNFTLTRSENSTLPPIINAFEIYTVKKFSQLETDQQDVEAMMIIKSDYGVKKNWQGDPCLPSTFLWLGLKCSPEGRIISLDLSSSGLTGEISLSISNLTMIQTLDLSNNKLTGPVPGYMSQLPHLKVLNLEKNDLKGPLPVELVERWKNGFLSLRFDASVMSGNSSRKKKKNGVVLAVALVGIFIFLLTLAAISWGLNRRRRTNADSRDAKSIAIWSLESRKRQFTYSEILQITNNFEKCLGIGGFGSVYHGYLEYTQVAVKMLSKSSVHGSQQFQTEVNILTRVHHRNLTTLIGYCNEQNCNKVNCNRKNCNHENRKALIYEFMAKGDLESYLSGSKSNMNLKWEDRVRIATEAAQGLEYLHYGCKPPIIHRDVKCSNILLNENFQSKISDFGLSKIFPNDNRTHVTTSRVVGTFGFLDPEYFASNKLNEKSDVYGFGIVLLEIITGRPAISKCDDYIHIGEWIKPMWDQAIIESIIDPRLERNYDINSAWKVAEIAMNCISRDPARRPTMTQIVGELKESQNVGYGDAIETMPLNLDTHELSYPTAR